MQTLSSLFGKSPFEHIVAHARKIHECVLLINPIAEQIIMGDLNRLRELQHQMSKTEYEADLLKDQMRMNLPTRFFLPVRRTDIMDLVRQLDRIGDSAEDFAVVATLRLVTLPPVLQPDFLSLAEKVIQVSETMLELTQLLTQIQRNAFIGQAADDVLAKIDQVCHMEWESDKLSRAFARKYYASAELDTISIILLDKLCRALTSIADHAENVGKDLRLMILRK
ncbi:MAG: TIGR00153 family protein [Lentisphaerae bacterium]|nr:TIGR00153 family protein [Lentisphaerota bacterium]